ncbi:hypothetical protein DES53_12030 [Roseimicrobium gellanilyticum]|uniref:Uncharacterized protein n=1 Tax=Roseimicrobium gellanilyticum TaxID=748857 RepID=A0A366H1A3_9BACT|nr:hypothetical protein [Roseimicrobium gellanilyticum]RBP35662.1 hypothetical protein DES53_12030 [Roseimicrobium gellanilyticum]
MKERADIWGAIAVAVMLVLTAWGNALVMAVVSVVGLLVVLFVFKGRSRKGELLAATVAFAVGAVIAFVMLSR